MPDDFRLLATPVAVVAGITYNFLPFMTLPLYVALEKIDRRLSRRPRTCTPGRGGRGGTIAGAIVGGSLTALLVGRSSTRSVHRFGRIGGAVIGAVGRHPVPDPQAFLRVDAAARRCRASSPGRC